MYDILLLILWSSDSEQNALTAGYPTNILDRRNDSFQHLEIANILPDEDDVDPPNVARSKKRNLQWPLWSPRVTSGKSQDTVLSWVLKCATIRYNDNREWTQQSAPGGKRNVEYGQTCLPLPAIDFFRHTLLLSVAIQHGPTYPLRLLTIECWMRRPSGLTILSHKWI